MSKKQFIELASRLQALKPNLDGKCTSIKAKAKMEQWESMVREMASFCATQNSNLNRERFLTACGL